MRWRFALAGVVAAGVSGCAALGYQPGDSYAHTRALANSGNSEAQLVLARMYAEPSAWADRKGRKPDGARAAKWCVIYQRQGVAARAEVAAAGPSCPRILAGLSPSAVFVGEGMAGEFGAEPMRWLWAR